MELFFIATEESLIYKDWFAYKADKNKSVKACNEFFEEQGIESTLSNSDKELVIVPTDKDFAKFKNVFKKYPCEILRDGRKAFEVKANSKLYKAWNLKLDGLGIKSLREPKLVYYINAYGRSRSKIIEHNGVLYCKYQNDDCDFNLPKGCTEINGSEYYKVIEANKAGGMSNE